MPELPFEWVGAETSGRVLRFTDTRHDSARLRDHLQRLFPDLPTPDVHPMTLRELFITLNAAGRLNHEPLEA